MGAMAVPTGGSTRPSGAAPAPARLEPGSAIATVLLTGDMDIAATGTVTWVEGSSVLAFGHPFLSMGPVDMPMADAEVLTVLPSVFRSFKFAATGSVARLDLPGPLERDPGQLRDAREHGADPGAPVLRRHPDADLPLRGRAQRDAHADPRGDGDRQRADDDREAHGRAHARLEVVDLDARTA